jgi:ATP-dependent Clp protease ATP-binding subunit ClpB
VNFRNTIVIMTSNLGSGVFQDPSLSAEKRRDEILDDVRGYFRPEFVNRIDEIVVFEPLTREDLRTIVDIQVRALDERLAARKLTLELTEDAYTLLANEGYDPTFGARPLKRLLQRELENPLATKLLSGEVRDGDTVRVAVTDGELRLERA